MHGRASQIFQLLLRAIPGIAALAGVSQMAFATPAAGHRLDCTRWTEAREAASFKVTIAGVPSVVSIPTHRSQAPVILWHGFGPPDSEAALHAALPLQDVPAIKVYLGLPLFGDRAPGANEPTLAERQSQDLATLVFEPVVLGAASELSSVVAALSEARCMSAAEPVALVGFSAGGAATYAALAAREVSIDAAVMINASTGLADSVAAYERVIGKTYPWTDTSRAIAARTDVILRAADIARGSPALLILHSEQDRMLLPQRAQEVYDALELLYSAAGQSDRLKLSLKNMPHSIADPATAAAVDKIIARWLLVQRAS